MTEQKSSVFRIVALIAPLIAVAGVIGSYFVWQYRVGANEALDEKQQARIEQTGKDIGEVKTDVAVIREKVDTVNQKVNQLASDMQQVNSNQMTQMMLLQQIQQELKEARRPR